MKDPKHFGFTLSRYKFAAKMLKGCRRIIEIGCGEGVGALMLLAETSAAIEALDFDECQIGYAKKNILPYAKDRIEFICHDMVSRPYGGMMVDGFVCIDVMEHVHYREEDKFLRNCASSVEDGGVAVFGTPNKFAEKCASVRSKKGHI